MGKKKQNRRGKPIARPSSIPLLDLDNLPTPLDLLPVLPFLPIPPTEDPLLFSFPQPPLTPPPVLPSVSDPDEPLDLSMPSLSPLSFCQTPLSPVPSTSSRESRPMSTITELLYLPLSSRLSDTAIGNADSASATYTVPMEQYTSMTEDEVVAEEDDRPLRGRRNEETGSGMQEDVGAGSSNEGSGTGSQEDAAGSSTEGSGKGSQEDVGAGSSNEGTKTPEEPPFYEVITSEQAFFEMNKILQQVHEDVKEKEGTIRKLLIACNWDNVGLVQVYRQRRAKLFEDAKIPLCNLYSLLRAPEDPNLDKSMKKCDSCKVITCPEEMMSMRCDHSYCKMCWIANFIIHINSGLVKDMKCLAVGVSDLDRCQIMVEGASIRKHLEGRAILKKYYRLVTHHFVEWHPKYRWCRSVVENKDHCTNAFEIHDTRKWGQLECDCGHSSCSACGEDWHYPIVCSMFYTWKEKCTTLLNENRYWSPRTGTMCLSCLVDNKKIQGNSIECQNAKCGKKFYILWGHPCIKDNDCRPEEFARYIPKPGEDADVKKREQFYYFRFKAHEDSLSLEEMDYHDLIQIRAKRLKKAEFIQAPAITKVLRRLSHARKLLMYSYVFAFYAKDSNSLETFVNHQGILEQAVEELSLRTGKFLRLAVKKIKPKGIKPVVNQSDLVELLRSNMVNFVNEGYEIERWNF